MRVPWASGDDMHGKRILSGLTFDGPHPANGILRLANGISHRPLYLR
jgi:hypothetical protein